jgi:DNA integrity scanning protein DisA with diadenylate cyclase activity
VGEEYEIFEAGESRTVSGDVSPAVFSRVIGIASSLAYEGREGRPTGALFVVGAITEVENFTSQMIINPFRGYAESERNILDPHLEETIKELAAIDGAFIIREDGVVLSAGTYVRATIPGEKLPRGLGARHEAAASITAATPAVAVTVSESTGTITIFKSGKIVMEIEKRRKGV